MYLENIGLVLEGGGMRGAYTAGVLDYLMQKKIKFPYVIGVSAGANNGADYVSEQRERNKRVFIDLVEDERYCGLKNLIKEGNYFGMDFLFKKLPNDIVPFDYETFAQSPITFKVVVTNCETGETEYFDKDDFDAKLFGEKILRASSSIPIITKPVEINGSYYYDGGVTNSIPLTKAIEDGYEHNVLILTRHKGFKLKSKRSKAILKLLLRDYPKLVNKLNERHKVYNERIKWINKLEKEGQVFVFRPQKKVKMRALNNNKEKLEELYQVGYEETKQRFYEFKKWMQKIENYKLISKS